MPRRDDPQRGLGKAIRTLRTEAQLTQEGLAERSHIHSTWISHLESGRINPTWGNIKRIADGLSIPLTQLAELAEQYEREMAAEKAV